MQLHGFGWQTFERKEYVLLDKSKPENGHCQSAVPGHLKKKKKVVHASCM